MPFAHVSEIDAIFTDKHPGDAVSKLINDSNVALHVGKTESDFD